MNKKENKRIRIIFFIILISFMVFEGRLTYLQIIKHEHYKQKSESNRILKIATYPKRAAILDRNKTPLAFSNELLKIRFHASPNEIKSLEKKLESITKNKQVKKEYKSLTISKLTWLELEDIIEDSDVPIPEIEMQQERIYPYSETSGNLIGYSQSEGNNHKGKYGIEKNLEEELKGKPGSDFYLINSRRRTLKRENSVPAKKSEDIKLSINAELQQAAYDNIKDEKQAAIIIIDSNTGEVLALASTPSFDPNHFSQGNKEKISQYYKEKLNPLFNLPVKGIFSMASTMKPFATIAALNQGIAKPINCTKDFFLGKKRFRCWKAHGTIDLIRILPESCDYAYYEWARTLSFESIKEVIEDFALDKPALEELEGKKGFFKAPSKKNKWKAADAIFFSIGQGANAFTLAQLTRAYARIATGKQIELTLLKSEKEDFPDLKTKKQTLDLIRKSLFLTVNSPGGTAYYFNKPIGTSIGISGKTGTSQVKKMKEEDYGAGNNHKKWKDKDHAIFCGFGPHPKNNITGCVIVVHGGGGGRIASPILMKTLKTAFEKHPLKKINQMVK